MSPTPLRRSRPLLGVAIAVSLFGAGVDVALAVDSQYPGPFVGCLAAKTTTGTPATKGQVYNIAKSSTTPLAPCVKGDSLVTFSNAQGPKGEPGPRGAKGEPGENGVSRGWTILDAADTVSLPDASGISVFVVAQIYPIDPQPANLSIVARATVTGAGSSTAYIRCQLATSNFPDFNGGYGDAGVEASVAAGESRELTLTAILPALERVGIRCERFDDSGPTLTFSDIKLTAVALDAVSF